MSKQEKKHQKIYDLLNAETKQEKMSKIIGVFYSLHQVQIYTHSITLYGAHKKTKQMQLPISILIRLRLLLWMNGIKMSGEFILKACKSFRRCVDKIIKRNGNHIV